MQISFKSIRNEQRFFFFYPLLCLKWQCISKDCRASYTMFPCAYSLSRYFEYPKFVTLFTQKKDWPKLRDSGFLFFRKASSESGELLDYIDAQHLLQEKEDGKAE